jgi:hypothetical protein
MKLNENLVVLFQVMIIAYHSTDEIMMVWMFRINSAIFAIVDSNRDHETIFG